MYANKMQNLHTKGKTLDKLIEFPIGHLQGGPSYAGV